MIFTAVCIHLKHSFGKTFTVEDGVHAHGAFFNAISRSDSELARAVHELKENKRFTLGFVSSRNGSSVLRFTFWDEEGIQLLNSLGNFFNHIPEMVIGSTTCSVHKFDFNDPQWCRMATSWNSFFEDGKNGSKIYFEFVSPMAIMKEGRQKNNRISHTLPDPDSIFLGLQRRWNQLGGPSLPEGIEEFITKGRCRISYFDIKTAEFKAGGRTQIGCLGKVTYSLDRELVLSPVFLALARFAAFVGIGYQTARGMGLVRVGVEG